MPHDFRAKPLSQFLLAIFILIMLFSTTGAAPARMVHTPLAQVSDITILPRDYNFTWGSSGQNIVAGNTVHCSANTDFSKVLYWRTNDTGGGQVTWQPNVVTAGQYDMYIYLPDYTHNAAITTQAKYYLDGGLIATIDQNNNKCQWLLQGRFTLGAGVHSIGMPSNTSENPYRLIAGDGLKLVYVPPPTPYYSIAGQVLDSANNPISGVTVSLSNGASTTTNSSGSYTFSSLLAGGYTVTPSRPGDSINPASRSINLTGNTSGQNFTLTSRYAITGRLADTGGNPIPNVQVVCQGISFQRSITTDSNGRYTCGDLVSGLYQIKPPQGIYTFSPTVRGWFFVPPNQTSQDFTTAPVYGNISGRVTVEGSGTGVGNSRVNVAGKVVQADGSGNYSITALLPGSHAVYANAAGYQDYKDSMTIEAGVTTTKNMVMKAIPAIGYRLPFPGGVRRQLVNIGHQSGYAEDWGQAIGQDVVAARGGTVIAAKGTSNIGGKNKSFIGKENYVTVLHDDKTTTYYVHLQQGSLQVKVNDTVKSGQVLGKSGMTGYTTFPHLHFAWLNSKGTRIKPSYLDVTTNGGVAQVPQWYTSNNYLSTATNMLLGAATVGDITPPVGWINFRLTSQPTYIVELRAFDTESDLLQVRMATSEAGFLLAGWQPVTETVEWTAPVVVAQFKDSAGNLSPVYSDILEAIAYEPIQAAFATSAQAVCTGETLQVQNQSFPLCEQCGWSWDMGDGTISTQMDPLFMEPTEGFIYSEPGIHTISMSATNVNSTSTISHTVEALPSPSADFTISRLGSTIWVKASDANASNMQWEFGDGVTAIGRSPTHTYANVETLEANEVKLTVSGQNGCSSTAILPIPGTYFISLPVVIR